MSLEKKILITRIIALGILFLPLFSQLEIVQLNQLKASVLDLQHSVAASVDSQPQSLQAIIITR
jgi:hypothetical protein